MTRDHDANEQIGTAHHLSRRGFLAGLGSAATAAAFLIGCGDGNDDSDSISAPDATSTGTGTASTSAFPAHVSHKFGITEVPNEPQRVLSLGYSDQDAILAVGIQPIATRYWFAHEPGAIFPWAKSYLTGAPPEVLDMAYDNLDFEQVAALKPDLIVAVYSGITADDYGTLSAIAPVVAQSADYIDYGMPWDEGARLIASALGRTDQMEQRISEVNDRYDAARKANPGFAGKQLVVAAMDTDGKVGVFAEQDQRMRFFTTLGFSLPEEFDGLFGDSFYADISAERMSMLDSADVVAWTQVVYAGGRDAIIQNSVYSQLSVAKESRHLFIDGYADAAFSFNSVLSQGYALDVVVPALAAASDGDPNTNVIIPADLQI
jgi:iron complex transport system substrate-binding protein